MSTPEIEAQAYVCNHCDESFSDKRGLKHHYTCRHQFKTKITLVQGNTIQIQRSNKTGWFACPDKACYYTTMSSGAIRQHYLRNHDKFEMDMVEEKHTHDANGSGFKQMNSSPMNEDCIKRDSTSPLTCSRETKRPASFFSTLTKRRTDDEQSPENQSRASYGDRSSISPVAAKSRRFTSAGRSSKKRSYPDSDDGSYDPMDEIRETCSPTPSKMPRIEEPSQSPDRAFEPQDADLDEEETMAESPDFEDTVRRLIDSEVDRKVQEAMADIKVILTGMIRDSMKEIGLLEGNRDSKDESDNMVEIDRHTSRQKVSKDTVDTDEMDAMYRAMLLWT